MMLFVYSGLSVGFTLPALSAWVEVAGAVVLVFILLALATSLLRFEYLTRIRPREAQQAGPALAAFPLQVAERLSLALRNADPFLVVLAQVAAPPGKTGAEHGAATWAAGLLEQGQLRRKDHVCIYRPDTLGMIIGATRGQAAGILRRVTGGLEAVGATVRTGLATFPEDGRRTADLLEQATRSLALPMPRPPPPADEGALTEPLPAEEAPYLDALTGVIRNERIESEARKYLAAYRRDGLPVAFLYVALDALEGYRSHYGEEGVRALVRATAQVLRRQVRTEDLIGRCDEAAFLVLLSCPPDAVARVAQRLTLAVRRNETRIEGHLLRATVCVGVSCCPMHEQRPGRLYAQAQTALQRAQARGQGLSLMYDPAWDAPRRRSAPVRERF